MTPVHGVVDPSVGREVAEFVVGFMEEGLKAAARAFAPGPLERAVARSLQEALRKVNVPTQYREQVEYFLKKPAPAMELSKVVYSLREEPDTELLLQALTQDGLDLATLPGLDFAGLFDLWAELFCDACYRESTLRELVEGRM